MASLFGITSAKYQYAIDEYSRSKREVLQSFIFTHCKRLVSELACCNVFVVFLTEGGES